MFKCASTCWEDDTANNEPDWSINFSASSVKLLLNGAWNKSTMLDSVIDSAMLINLIAYLNVTYAAYIICKILLIFNESLNLDGILCY